MDISKDGFYGQLKLPEGDTIAHRGSIMSIVAESLKDIKAGRLSRSKDGSEILIRIRDQPFDTSRDALAAMNKAVEVSDLLDDSSVDESMPRANEDYEAFVHRLESDGYPRASSLMIAAEWYSMPKDAQAVGWLTDDKAKRFRELNTRNEAFEAALPSEYESLKQYVIAQFPDFTRDLVFRTA